MRCPNCGSGAITGFTDGWYQCIDCLYVFDDEETDSAIAEEEIEIDGWETYNDDETKVNRDPTY